MSRLRGLAWTLDLDVTSANSTPIAINGVVYVAAGYSIVYAVDGKSGKQLWRYDRGRGDRRAKAAQRRRHRGLAHANGRLFVGTHDGRPVALDAKKGHGALGRNVLREE